MKNLELTNSKNNNNNNPKLEYLLRHRHREKKSYGYSLLLLYRMLTLLSDTKHLVGIRQSHFLTYCITWYRIKLYTNRLVNNGFIKERQLIHYGRGSKKKNLREAKYETRYFFMTPKGMLLLSKLATLNEILAFEKLQQVDFSKYKKEKQKQTT